MDAFLWDTTGVIDSLTMFTDIKNKEMRKPEYREGKEKNKGMRKINRTALTAISVKRKASAGWKNATTCSRKSRKRRREPVRAVLMGRMPPVSASAC